MNSSPPPAGPTPESSTAEFLARGAEAPLPSEAELEARTREFFATWGVLDRLAHVEVIFNPRLRTTVGRAHLRTIQIQLNPRLLSRVPDRLDEVLAHEAAHLAIGLEHGVRLRPHGPEWAQLMVAVGYSPRVTHDLPLAGLRRGRSFYLHRCAGCGRRRILTRSRAVRDCGCEGCRVEVFRAPRTPAGRAALRAHR